MTAVDLSDAELAALQHIRAGLDDEPALAIERPTETASEKVDRLIAEEQAAEVEDFDRFWAAQQRTGKVLRNVRGVDVHLPASLPLAFEIESRRLMRDESVAAVHKLFALLFGDGTLAELIARGLTGDQLAVLLMWGTRNGNGIDTSLGEAQAEFERLKALKAAGKAPVPSTGSGGTSSGSGRSSKPTSPGSTRGKRGRKKGSRG